jgi:hypothetical protein
MYMYITMVGKILEIIILLLVIAVLLTVMAIISFIYLYIGPIRLGGTDIQKLKHKQEYEDGKKIIYMINGFLTTIIAYSVWKITEVYHQT